MIDRCIVATSEYKIHTRLVRDHMAQQLINALEQATRFDSWGQRLEALDEYERFHVLFEQNKSKLKGAHNQEAVEEIVKKCQRRLQDLKSGRRSSLTCESLKDDLEFLKQLNAKEKDFARRRLSSVDSLREEFGLLPAVKYRKANCSYLSISIEKIGLKDASSYIDPFVSVTVRDLFGREIGQMQCSRPSEKIEDRYIIFNTNVHIQEPLEDLPKGYAIFMEFKHFKPRKNKISQRCFAFIEADEIEDGPAVCELYKKPVDYSRRKLYLFTEKQLYLHVVHKLTKSD